MSPPIEMPKNILGWTDPFFSKIAEFSPAPQRVAGDLLADNFGMEGIASVVEMAFDMVLTPLGSRIALPVVGGITGLVGLFAPDMNARLRRELLFFANHNLFRVLDVSPSQAMEQTSEIRGNVEALVKGIEKGDLVPVRDAFLRSVEDIKKLLAFAQPAQGQASSSSYPKGSGGVDVVEIQADGSAQQAAAKQQVAQQHVQDFKGLKDEVEELPIT